ncbi:hypothetical protein QFZ71_000952 [Streptomyces sp. V2I9]|nr:hypothetical protein [Streptomyces sp. V2I9]
MIIAPPTPSRARAAMRTAGVSARRGDRGGRAEQRVAQEQHASPADPVTEGAEEDEERGADEGVGVDDPQEGGAARAEVLGEGGDGDVEHGRVERDDQETEAEDHEDDPAVGAVGGLAQPSRGRGRPGHLRTSRWFLALGGPAATRGARPSGPASTGE